ncbi:MAG: hypothetical protein IPM80_16800 [Proteobacteria bacterium]|jgi:hypothetical protein|nr:hypothetical protein [Pseudomonadota bacterium]
MAIALIIFCLLGLFAGTHSPDAARAVRVPSRAAAPIEAVREPDHVELGADCALATPHYRDLSVPDSGHASTDALVLCR